MPEENADTNAFCQIFSYKSTRFTSRSQKKDTNHRQKRLGECAGVCYDTFMQEPNIKAVCFDLIGVFVQSGRLQTELVALAEKIQKTGLKILCYSNSPGDYFESLDATNPFLYVFDETYYADTLMPKTEEGFRLLSRKTGTPSAHILLIDDTSENLSMARNVGFQTYWYNKTRPAPLQNLKEYLRISKILYE